jgi:hypothetical protein
MYPPILTRGKRVAVAEVGRALHKRREREKEKKRRRKPDEF